MTKNEGAPYSHHIAMASQSIAAGAPGRSKLRSQVAVAGAQLRLLQSLKLQACHALKGKSGR